MPSGISKWRFALEIFLLYLALLTLLFYVAITLDFVRGNRSLRFLKDVAPVTPSHHHAVSVIIAARNEERKIEEALWSVLNQDYFYLEVIVVNDRSTDGTAAILDSMARRSSRLTVVHLSALPPGWLGKTYALQSGAERASGEFYLFTDADVVMEGTVVSRALNFMLESSVDHLTVAPEVRIPGLLLNMFVGAFNLFFGLYARPWKARDPKSRKHIGIGAFNLFRASAYRACGTHEMIAMRPDDDMKLGKLVKKHGLRQDVLFGKGMISVEWYSSLGELVNGLAKNAFAGVEYSVPAVVAATVAILAFNVWPFIALFLTRGLTQALNGLSVLVILILFWDNARFHGIKPWYGVAFPISSLVFLYILWSSMVTTIINRGIDWRGTHYSLEELRANKV